VLFLNAILALCSLTPPLNKILKLKICPFFKEREGWHKNCPAANDKKL
jgi:hypothetical protein